MKNLGWNSGKGFEIGSLNMEKKWVFPLVITSLVCVFLLVTSFNMGLVSSLHTFNAIFSIFPSRVIANQTKMAFAEEKIKDSPLPPPPAGPVIPRFAYLISGSRGDLDKLWRTLHTLYHPLNHYVLHLDLESPAEERLELASRVEREPVFAKIGNVMMITKANMVTYRGPTMVANTLHACAILLKRTKDWDWFINLSASDYPLVTQDGLPPSIIVDFFSLGFASRFCLIVNSYSFLHTDLLSTFLDLKRDLNFIEHTSRLGWKEEKRAMPLIMDPGLYKATKSDIFWVTPRRTLPTAFKLFTGSAWMILSHSYVEYLVWGWDNLPRTLLMYYTNFVSSPEGYFQTVICNVPDYVPTVINHDMHYIAWDVPPKQHPHILSLNDSSKMIESGAAFARKFKQDDPVLDKIDRELLGRKNGGFTPGGWCSGSPPCSEVGNPKKLRPGPGAHRLRGLVDKLLLSAMSDQNQCH